MFHWYCIHSDICSRFIGLHYNRISYTNVNTVCRISVSFFLEFIYFYLVFRRTSLCFLQDFPENLKNCVFVLVQWDMNSMIKYLQMVKCYPFFVMLSLKLSIWKHKPITSIEMQEVTSKKCVQEHPQNNFERHGVSIKSRIESSLFISIKFSWALVIVNIRTISLY